MVVYVLLFIEFILILLAVVVPKIISWATTQNAAVIVYTPVDFSETRSYILPNDVHVKDAIPRQNFALSMWINVNTPNIDFKDERIVMSIYGQDGLAFLAISCTAKDTWKFYTKGTVFAEIRVPSQRWNYVVFNCQENQMDLFLNGQLVSTSTLIIKRHSMHTLGTGSDKYIHGAICNIMYFQRPITLHTITTTYNLLKLKHPPIT